MSAGPLEQAAVFAGRAPSLHNSQPWHWYAADGRLDLRLEPSRVLHSSDPHARLAILSCGAALHHARVHLSAAGLRIDVIRVPDPDDPTLLARLLPGDPALPDRDAERMARAATHRHTDRRGTPSAPLDRHRVQSIRRAVHGGGAGLAVVRPDQLFTLAQAAEHAHGIEEADPGWQVEVARWVGGDRPSGVGIPASALPEDPYLLTAPARVLRRTATALVADSRHHAAVFTILHTSGDGRLDWLVAGEGLSAGWLTATDLDVAVLPLSVVTEVARSRDRIRSLLDRSGNPQLILRLAVAGAETPPFTPRLAAESVVTAAHP